MKEVINHQNIGTLMNLTETISKLDDYLSHINKQLEKKKSKLQNNKATKCKRTKNIL